MISSWVIIRVFGVTVLFFVIGVLCCLIHAHLLLIIYLAISLLHRRHGWASLMICTHELVRICWVLHVGLWCVVWALNLLGMVAFLDLLRWSKLKVAHLMIKVVDHLLGIRWSTIVLLMVHLLVVLLQVQLMLDLLGLSRLEVQVMLLLLCICRVHLHPIHLALVMYLVMNCSHITQNLILQIRISPC